MEFFAEHWEKIALGLLIAQNVIKGVRDALDSTPETDDNKWEKLATVASKVLGYLVGFRAKK